jgi:hypothetical protein
MSYADHVRQLQDHAARTAVEADRAIDTWLERQTETNALAMFDALNAADYAAWDVRWAVASQLATAGN